MTAPNGEATTALERILASSTFSPSAGLSKLLRYLVDEALAGRIDRLKEYTLGVEVFGRGERFDPKTDTIVRVQARRLRAKLDEYYEHAGAGDELEIAVPKGAYVPEFRQRAGVKNGSAGANGRLDLAGVYRPDAKAHGLYVEGRRLANQGTSEALLGAIAQFEASIAIDPNYALSHWGLADSYLQLSSAHFAPHDAMPKARAAALKAIELDPSLDKAHAALGTVHLLYDWDRRATEERVRTAIALNPKSAEAHLLYATSAASDGRISDALSHLHRAQELDPFSLKLRFQTQATHLIARDYEAAIEEGLKTLRMAPGFSLGRAALGLAYSLHGDEAVGLDHLRLAVEQEDGPWQNLYLQHGYAWAGDRKRAERLVLKLEDLAQQRYMCAYEIGEAHAVMDDEDAAFAWLEKALDERSDCFVWLEMEPWMDCIRSADRYPDLIARFHRDRASQATASTAC